MLLPCSPMDLKDWSLQHHNTSEYTLGRHMYLLVMAHVRNALSGCSSPTALSRGNYVTHSAVPQQFHQYGGAHSFGGLTESHPITPPSLHGGDRSIFPGSSPPDHMVNSKCVVGIKPGDSDVVIGYQVDEFICTQVTEFCIAQSHIYHCFTGKVSTLNHFLLEPGCVDYSFLDQAVEDFKLGLDSFFTESTGTPELDASFDEADAMPPSVVTGFLCSVLFLIILDYTLAPRLKSHKLWCQTRALLFPVPQIGKMSFITFLVIQQLLYSALLYYCIISL